MVWFEDTMLFDGDFTLISLFFIGYRKLNGSSIFNIFGYCEAPYLEVIIISSSFASSLSESGNVKLISFKDMIYDIF